MVAAETDAGDGRLDFPLKLTVIYVIMHRQSLSLTKMIPGTQSLRFKNLSVMGDAKSLTGFGSTGVMGRDPQPDSFKLMANVEDRALRRLSLGDRAK